MPVSPLVTIVTPAYNQADYLAETIESVLSQTYPNIEYIVIDDGSTDHTAEIIDRYADRLKGYTHSNRGQARTLNEGWAQASGKYLTYLSSDDTLHPDAIARLVEALEADEGRVCAFPDADLIDEGSAIVRRNVCRPFDLAALVVEQECYIGPGAVFRQSAFAQAGGWRADLKLAPDREFWMRLSRFGSFFFLDEALAGYRIHPGSISYKLVSEEASMEYIRVLDGYFEGSVPETIAARRKEAYGRAHFLVARNCYRASDFKRGNWHYGRAKALFPPLASLRSRLVIARTVVSKPIRVAMGRVRKLFQR